MADLKVKVTKAPSGDKRKDAHIDAFVGELTKFRPRLWIGAGLVFTALVFGTPHLLVTYHCYGSCNPGRAYACDYLGIGGWRASAQPVQDSCPIIRLLR